MRNFIGRHDYLDPLENLWHRRRTVVISIYGRRRIGKTELIRVFSKNKTAWCFEALEGADTPTQVRHFLKQLGQYVGEPHLADLSYRDWPPVFDLLSEKMKAHPHLVIAFDELSWMAAGRSQLVSYLKFYWDKEWKAHPHLLLILCGSVAAWMVKHVVKSQALYGRISENILIDALKPFEVAEFIGKKRGMKETLEYLLIFGGVPRYLEEMDFKHSIQLNIETTCFQAAGFFVDEAEKIFYNQFKETILYKQIATYLLAGPRRLEEIAKRLKITSGGGLKQYLDNLRAAGIIDAIPELRQFVSGKRLRYYLTDAFLRFHFQFIQPHLAQIRSATRPLRFETVTRNQWYPFMGYAFERFCLTYRYAIAAMLGFDAKVTAAGPLSNLQKNGFQYDLVYLRNDHVISLCEVKYVSEPVGTRVIQEMEAKFKKTSFPKGSTIERVLISNQEASLALQESGYFHHFLYASDLVTYRNY